MGNRIPGTGTNILNQEHLYVVAYGTVEENLRNKVLKNCPELTTVTSSRVDISICSTFLFYGT